MITKKKEKKFSAILSKVVRGELLMDSQVFILDELGALNVHYFPTFSCT